MAHRKKESGYARELGQRRGANFGQAAVYKSLVADPSISAEEHEREAENRWQLAWLLNLTQRDTIAPDDDRKVVSFVKMISDSEPEASPRELQEFAREIASELRPYLTGENWLGRSWSFEVKHAWCVFDPNDDRDTILRTDNWQLAFRLRAAQLLARYRKAIRKCQREECGRVFLASGKQIFCSKRCSDLKRLHKYRGKITATKKEPEKEKRFNATQTRKK